MMAALRPHSLDTTLTRKEICSTDNDMNEQSSNCSGVESFEKVFSDIRAAAKEMILRMQEPNDERSLEKIEVFHSSLRQSDKMLNNLDYQFRRLLGASCFLEALIARQAKATQRDQGLYEELLKECDILKSQISTEHSRLTKLDFLMFWLQLLKLETDLKQMKAENKSLNYSELLPIAKSIEDMRQLCVKNEETLVKEMDFLQHEIVQREEDIKELNLKLQSVQSFSNEDRNKLQRHTVKEAVEVPKRESALTTDVRSEPSHQLERLIEEEQQLEQEKDGTQKDLTNHEMLLSGHVGNMTDSPISRGPSTLSLDEFKNEEVTLRKHGARANRSVSTDNVTRLSTMKWFRKAFNRLSGSRNKYDMAGYFEDEHNHDGASTLPRRPSLKAADGKGRHGYGVSQVWEQVTLEYPAEFIVKDLWKLDQFIGAKINELQKCPATESQLDIVFLKCLNSFHNELTCQVAFYLQDGMPPNVKYRDMIDDFENTMESICKEENVSHDFSVTLCKNAFCGYLDEFRKSRKNGQTKPERQKRLKVNEKVIEHNGHTMSEVQFEILKFCETCTRPMWTYEKGHVCQVCGYFCHMTCLSMTTRRCRGTRDSDQSLVGTKIFGVPLTDATEEKIIAFLDLMIQLIEKHGMHIEGIYSEPGADSKVKKLKMRLDSGARDIHVDEFPVNVLTSTLKAFFRELPEPLFTFDLYDEFIQASEIVDVRAAIQKLPRVNRDVLNRLIFHLTRVVHERCNKMSTSAIAGIFTPCLMRSNKAVPIQEFIDQHKKIRCIEIILTEELWNLRAPLQDNKTIDADRITAEDSKSIGSTSTQSEKDTESQPLEEDQESLGEQERLINPNIEALSKEMDVLLASGLFLVRDRHNSGGEILSAEDIDTTEDTELPSNGSPFECSGAKRTSVNRCMTRCQIKISSNRYVHPKALSLTKVKYECQKLCNSILQIEHVMDVYPAYKENDVTSVIFIVTVSRQSDSISIHLNDLRIDWIIKSIDISHSEISGNMVIQLKEQELEMLRRCFEKHAHALMTKHHYLSIIEGCNYTLDNETECATNALKYEPRFALYVHAKGYIPINEEPFEKSYDGVRVVVKEGVYIPFVNTANTKHPHVRMGCQIQRAQLALNGTLGLFIEHSTYGLCGLTCAHVMLTKEEHALCKTNDGLLQSDSFLKDVDVYQPEHPHVLGKLVEAIQKEGSVFEASIDMALIQIKERHPVDGTFPTDETDTAFDFESGKTLKPSMRNGRCYKFGKASGYTDGTLINTGQLSFVKDVFDFQGYTFVLCNQIKVQSSGQLFAIHGDSGAPVFVKDGDGKLACIGIVVGGTKDGMVYVTPITRILQELGISQLKTFIPNIADLAKDIHLIKSTMETLRWSVESIHQKLDSK